MKLVPPAAMAPVDWLRDRATEGPDAPALFSASGAQLFNFGELSEEVSRLASYFANLGLGRDTKVMVCMKDGPDALVVILSLMSVAAVVPVHVTASRAQIEGLVHKLGVCAIVGAYRPASAAWGVAETQNLCYISVDSSTAQTRQLQMTPHRPVPVSQRERMGLDDTALCISTSGTTGNASIVMVSQRSLDLNVSTHGLLNGYGPGTRAVCVMSFAYLLSYVRASLPILRFGGAISVAPGYRFADFRECCEVFKPNCMTATPTVLQKILADAEAQDWRPDAGVLTRFHATGEGIPDTLQSQLANSFGATFGTNYGMTEVSPQVASRGPDDTFGPNAVGKLVPPWVAETVDEEGCVLPQGTTGRVALRGGHVNAVFGLAQDTRFDAEGRFLTGDRGYVDEAGVLYLVGRADDVINRGGEKLDPKEIELAFQHDPDVDRAVVFGVEGGKLGHKIFGLLRLRKGANRDLEDIRASVGKDIPGWGQPERFFVVSDFPTNANGKVSRSDLAERYQDE